MIWFLWFEKYTKMYKNEYPISYRLWPHCVIEKKRHWYNLICNLTQTLNCKLSLIELNSLVQWSKEINGFFSSWFLFCNRNLQSLFVTPFFAISHHCAACCPEGFVFFFLQRNCFLERLSWYGCNTFDWMKGRVKAVLEFQGLTLENIRTHKIILLLVNHLTRLKIIYSVWTFHNSHCLGMSYYVNFLESLGSNEVHMKWRFGTHGSLGATS